MIRLGTAGWSIPSLWATAFPAAPSQLERYGARMKAVEINTSFYRPHQRKTYERWAASVPPDFRFAVKLPKVITHENGLRNFETPLARFREEIAGLGDKLGPILVQLPPSLSFDPAAASALFRALEGQAVCEPRHATWFTDKAEAFFRRHHVARVAADPPRHPGGGRPGGWPHLAYWRWHGAPRIYWSAYDDARLATLTDAVSRNAAPDRWCIFDNTASGAALNDALRLDAMLEAATGPNPAGTIRAGTPYYRAEQENPMARKYSKAASKKVGRALHEMKRGTLKSGGSGKTVKSRKQAIAIGLSEARAAGKKAPAPKKKAIRKKAARKKPAKKTKR